jgi:hypothetical protein
MREVQLGAPTDAPTGIPLSRSRTLRVVQVRDDEADERPVLVVEDMS